MTIDNSMKKLLFILILPWLLASCVGETSYMSDTGTLSIPWGEKEGTRNPDQAIVPGANT